MKQSDIDQLLFTRDKYCNYNDRRKTLALEAIKLEFLLEKDKNKHNQKWADDLTKKIKHKKDSAIGCDIEYQKLTDKINKISNHLYGTSWAAASSFHKDKIEERKKKELINKL